MLSAGQDPEARLAPGTVTLPLCSRPDASPFWVMLLLVWRRSEHGRISPQRRLPSRFRGRAWRDGGSWQRQHHGDQLGKHHGDWWSCDAGPWFWPDLQSRKTCSHQTEGNAIASPSWVRWRTSFGTRGSQVQILPLRPSLSKNFGLLRQWMRQSFAGRRKNMRPDIKDGFDKAVAADAARTTAQREAQERARTEHQNFKSHPTHTRAQAIFPPL